MTGKIRDELTHLTVPIDDITPLPDNPRRGNETVIQESLKENQQYRPVLVQRSTGHIIAGNHTWHAARNAGWEHIAAQFLDVTDGQAHKIAVADNRIGDLATYDEETLLTFLNDLPDLDGTGYNPDDLQALEQALDVPDLDDLANEMGKPKPDDGWPSISMRVPHTVKAAWNAHLSTHSDDAAQAMAALLDVDFADIHEG